MVFGQMAGDVASAQTNVSVFDTYESVRDAGLLQGLTFDQQDEIVNWSLINDTPIVVNDFGPDVDDGDAGNGMTTLREAVNLANATSGVDTINFDLGFSAGQSVLLDDELLLTEDVIIHGPGQNSLAINGQGQNRIFSFDSSVNLANILDVTLLGGYGNSSGGAINFSSSAGTLTVDSSLITGNTAAGSGGAIYSGDGAVVIESSAIIGNRALSNAGAISNSGGLTVTKSTIANNHASSFGGGIDSFGPVTIDSSTISGNTAGNDGGGVYNSNSLTILNSTISGNHSGDDGGGLFGLFASALTIDSSIIAGNTSTDMGPDIFSGSPTVQNSFIGTNTGSGLTASPSTQDPSGNFIGDATPIDPLLGPLAVLGGDIPTHALLPGSDAIDNGANPNGLALDQRGQARMFGAGVDMGAFELRNTLTVTTLDDELDAGPIDPADLSLREAIAEANADSVDVIDFDPSLADGTLSLTLGELAVSTPSLLIQGSDQTIDGQGNSRIFGVTGTGDVALSHLSLTDGQATGNGGAIDSQTTGTLTVNSSQITGNTASGSGGGISVTGTGNLTIQDSRLLANSSQQSGGAVGVDGSGNLGIAASDLSGNSASSRGGGLFAASNHTIISNSKFTGNNANFNGGGVHFLNGNASISDSRISGNTGNDGGGVESYYTNLTVSQSTISRNTATEDGGGINSDGGNLAVLNSTVSGNSAAEEGGGLMLFTDLNLMDTKATVSGSTISGNTASGTGGGGIYNVVGLTRILNTTITGNSAPDNLGSGVGSIGSSLVRTEVRSSIISGNVNTDVDFVFDPTNSFVSLDNNLIGGGNATGNFTGGSDTTGNVDPGLDVLGFNGGPTKTHAVLPTSPARDTGSNPDGLPFDQRGADREFSAPDIGAFELGSFFVVDSLGDNGDDDPFDDLCDDGTGSCTLRAALEQSNDLFGSSPNSPLMIFFDINGAATPPHVFAPGSALPDIFSPVVIAGTSEPDYAGSPVVQVDNTAGLGIGLNVTGTGVTVRGLSVTGFDDSGVRIISAAGNNKVEHSWLGLDPTGAADGNDFGVRIQGSPNNIVSDVVASGNDRSGIFATLLGEGNTIVDSLIGTDPTGMSAIPNGSDGVLNLAPETQIGIPGHGNTISGNFRYGVLSRFADRTAIVQGNQIGTNIDGDGAIANVIGVYIQNNDNLIGGAQGLGNVISGNSAFGVAIAFATGNENVIQGNAIGTNEAGDTAIANGIIGMRITEGSDNLVGGPSDLQGNLISGNADGVLVAFPTSSGNQIVNNRIGTDITGNTAISNTIDGVRFAQGANNNQVVDNQISGNGGQGVNVDNSASNNDILFNLIGTNADATAQLLNGTGGALRLRGPGSQVIGNTISSVDDGILAFGNGNGLNITGNFIGTDELQLNNLGMVNGVRLFTSDNSVTGNVIANNAKGVVIAGGTSSNEIRSNSIFNNSLIGIDLGDDGATANDANDFDAGVNNLQNSPVISAAALSGNSLSITYLVDSTAQVSAYNLTIEFFLSDGSGQGRTLIGINEYLTPERQNNKTIVLDVAGLGLNVGDEIVATATDADGNTSEFSLEFAITS